MRRIDHSIEVVSVVVFRKDQLKCVFTKEARTIQKEWPRIKIRQAGALSSDKSKKEQRQKSVWRAPKKGWIKVNFDGDAIGNGNPSKSGAGFIVWNQYGKTLAFGANRLLDGTNNEAKFQAA